MVGVTMTVALKIATRTAITLLYPSNPGTKLRPACIVFDSRRRRRHHYTISRRKTDGQTDERTYVGNRKQAQKKEKRKK